MQSAIERIEKKIIMKKWIVRMITRILSKKRKSMGEKRRKWRRKRKGKRRRKRKKK
jgi:hypothetical protein